MKKQRLKSRKTVIISWQTFAIVGCFLAVLILTRVIGGSLAKFNAWQKQQQEYFAIFQSIVPNQGIKRSLLLFTNNAEQRFGGGFIGSIGLIVGHEGAVKFDSVHSVYYFDHRTKVVPTYVPMPPYLEFLTGHYGVRDAAQFADWPSSAASTAKMYEISTGIKPDNVVLITPEVLKKLLEKTGPIDLPEYKLVINRDNILDKLQLEVEAGQDKKQNRDPKSILGVLATKILAKMSDQKAAELYEQRTVLAELVSQKQIALYSADKNIQNLIENYDLSASFNKSGGNFVQVASANYGTNKSSPFISQSIDQQLTVDQNGKASVTMTVKRKHTSDYAHHYIDPKLGPQWLIGVNKTYNKIFLPKGSKLLGSSLPSSEIAISEESNRTTIGYNMVINPLAQGEIAIRYELPFRYQMNSAVEVGTNLEKQVGGFADQVNYCVQLPENYFLQSANRQELTTKDGHATCWRGILDTNKYIEVTYAKK